MTFLIPKRRTGDLRLDIWSGYAAAWLAIMFTLDNSTRAVAGLELVFAVSLTLIAWRRVGWRDDRTLCWAALALLTAALAVFATSASPPGVLAVVLALAAVYWGVAAWVEQLVTDPTKVPSVPFSVLLVGIAAFALGTDSTIATILLAVALILILLPRTRSRRSSD